MALLVAAHPRKRVIDHVGFDDTASLRALVAVDPDQVRVADDAGLLTIRSWASAPAMQDGVEVGTLFVADRRRRWFYDEEVRHLRLMSSVAADLIATLTALDLVDAVDVRDERAPLASLT